MEYIIVIAVVTGIALMAHLVERTRKLTSHVAERLRDEFLQPIEERAFRAETNTHGKAVSTLDEDSFRGLIAYVKQARRLLRALGTDRWGNTIHEKDVRSKLVKAADWEFFRRRQNELEIEVAFDPFAIWARELNSCAEVEGLDLDRVIAIEICPHRHIAFRTATRLFNAAQGGAFPCRECKQPSDVFVLGNT